VRMSLIPPPHMESYASYLAATQLVEAPQTRTAALGDDPVQLPALQFLKSLDDLDEEEDKDDDVEDLEDEEDDDEDEDEDEEEDLDEDYEDEDEEEDDDDDEEEDEEDEDEDGGVKPLKMTPASSRK
jgi:ribonuclease E